MPGPYRVDVRTGGVARRERAGRAQQDVAPAPAVGPLAAWGRGSCILGMRVHLPASTFPFCSVNSTAAASREHSRARPGPRCSEGSRGSQQAC